MIFYSFSLLLNKGKSSLRKKRKWEKISHWTHFLWLVHFYLLRLVSCPPRFFSTSNKNIKFNTFLQFFLFYLQTKILSIKFLNKVILNCFYFFTKMNISFIMKIRETSFTINIFFKYKDICF